MPFASARFFYQKNNVQAVLQAGQTFTFAHALDVSLAQCSASDSGQSALLLGSDQQASTLCEQESGDRRTGSYTPYGMQAGLQALLGFTGQLKALGLPGYLLGNGYRLYSPVLMRFYSPDSWSPFDKGGINAYAYCEGDPVNFSDANGHMKRMARNTPPSSPPSTSRSRSPQRVAGTSAQRSRTPSPDSVLREMMENPGWQPARIIPTTLEEITLVARKDGPPRSFAPPQSHEVPKLYEWFDSRPRSYAQMDLAGSRLLFQTTIVAMQKNASVLGTLQQNFGLSHTASTTLHTTVRRRLEIIRSSPGS